MRQDASFALYLVKYSFSLARPIPVTRVNLFTSGLRTKLLNTS